jgi:hypothetical protein
VIPSGTTVTVEEDGTFEILVTLPVGTSGFATAVAEGGGMSSPLATVFVI